MHAGYPDLKKLRAFDAAARYGSLAAAAQALRISQPAVTYLIGRLEVEIGMRLLDRDPHGSHLNASGRAFAERTRRFLDLVQEAVDTGASAHGPDRKLQALCARLTRTQCSSLLALWRTEDLRGAARTLGIGQQAVVRAVRSLESLLGIALVEQTPGGLRLNAQGRETSRRLALAEQEIFAGLQVIGSDRALGAHGLRIGALVLSPRLLLAEAVEICARSDSRQTIEIVEGAYEELVVLLRAGTIDLIFGALRDPPPFADLAETRLHEDPYVVACRRGHPLASRKHIRPQDLAGSQFIIATAGLRQTVLQRLLAHWKIEASPQIHTNWLPTIAALLRSSDRLAILSQWHIDADGAHEIQALPMIDVPHETRWVGLTTRSSWLPTPFQEIFIEALRRRVDPQSRDERPALRKVNALQMRARPRKAPEP